MKCSSPLLGLLMILYRIQGSVGAERIVFVRNVSSVVWSVQNLVLLALFALRRFFALLILASQLFLPFLECCA